MTLYAAAALCPGMNEAARPPSAQPVLFHLLPSKMFVYTFATGAAVCEIEMVFAVPRNSPFEVKLRVIYWLFDTKLKPSDSNAFLDLAVRAVNSLAGVKIGAEIFPNKVRSSAQKHNQLLLERFCCLRKSHSRDFIVWTVRCV